MAFIGFLVALALFFYYKRQLSECRRRIRTDAARADPLTRTVNWQDEWYRQWASKFQVQAERRLRQIEEHAERRRRRLIRRATRLGLSLGSAEDADDEISTDGDRRRGQVETLARLRQRRARSEAGYYTHLMTYLGVMAILALINLFTTRYPWFLWPALGWGIGLFSHYMAVFGSQLVRERYFYPAVDREVRREKLVMHTEKRATIDELSASIAHELRNPIAAAKSLVQQIGEEPASDQNIEYARVAVEELDRVERRIAHLLKYAKEEDYTFGRVGLAQIVDSALTQMRARLDAAGVRVARNYIGGPTILGDAEKLRQVFANILGNAIDALQEVPHGRRVDLFIENEERRTTVRVRDNGPGIPADRIDRIFNPFFTTKETGTGLGMAISKKIVDAHDGMINVISETGCGAEFIVSLPLPG